MKVLLKRIYYCSTYCIGHIYIDGTYVCDTIEDTDRGLDKSWPLSKIVKTKVKSKTAIPTGIYTLTLNIVSPKFSQVEYYKNTLQVTGGIVEDVRANKLVNNASGGSAVTVSSVNVIGENVIVTNS